ncbi:unnamed protein product, partial [Didymodactylos carnosus]
MCSTCYCNSGGSGLAYPIYSVTCSQSSECSVVACSIWYPQQCGLGIT